MRELLIAAAVAAAGLVAITQNAQAVTAGPNAIQNGNPVEKVAYVCRRVRVCGPNGCGWRRQCYETGPRYYPGYGYRGYGYESPTAHVCAPGWSFQDGACKPYRGP
jgi:hypothetical protein